MAFVAFALFGAFAAEAAPIRPNSENHYAIKSDNKVIGYSVYKVGDRMKLAGENFIKYRSLSVIRAGIGDVVESVFQSDFSINTETYLPSYFIMQQSINGFEAISETVYSEGLIAQKNAVLKGQPMTYINETDKPCFVFVTNLWGRIDSFVEHYDIFIRHANGAKETSFDVYDPILRTVGSLVLIKERSGSYSFKGASRNGDVYLLKDYYGVPVLRIFYDPKEERIYRMDEIAGHITFELSSVKAAEELRKSSGVDIGENRTALSPVFFPKLASLKMTGLTGKIAGRGFVGCNHEALGFSQTFKGESSDSSVEGVFAVKRTDFKIDKPNRFPPFKLDSKFDPYLAPMPGIECKDDFIVNKSQEITWKSRDCRTAAGRICKWIKENVKDGVSLPSAVIAFSTGTGNQESKSMLMTAMCRAAGMPARMAGGIVFDKGYYIPGYWVEVYIEGSGWLPFDVESGEEGVSPARIWLFEFGEVTGISIESLDFLPKPPKRVPFHRKDISWPVGESRVYEIKLGGKVIGKERARIKDMTFAEDGESYIFASDVLMRVAGVDFRARADASFDVNALPLSCELSGGLSEKNRNVAKFVFTNNYIEIILGEDKDGNVIKNNIPYSKGTYLVDKRFTSLWALVGGQIPGVELGGKYKFHAFIPEGDDMRLTEFEVEAKGFERIEADGRDFNAFRCESTIGVVFYIDQNGRVLRIDVPDQKLECTLIETRMLSSEEEEEPLTLDDGKEGEDLTGPEGDGKSSGDDKSSTEGKDGGDSPAVDSKSSGDSPAADLKSSGDSPAADSKSSGDSPAADSKSSGDSPAADSKSSGDSPAADSKSSGDSPAADAK